jgi:hypothetical protein
VSPARSLNHATIGNGTDLKSFDIMTMQLSVVPQQIPHQQPAETDVEPNTAKASQLLM